MGYAAGIGPELIVKTLVDKKKHISCRLLVIGDVKRLQDITETCNLSISWNEIQTLDQAEFEKNRFDIIDLHNISSDDFEYGKVISSLGKASGEYLDLAWELAEEKKIQGIVSGVLSKEALYQGGFLFKDELEFFSKITKCKKPFLIGIADRLWTVPVTVHLPFREIVSKITKENIFFHIKAIHVVMQRFGFKKPRIAVSALNVHGGESGLFGDEELNVIIPAIEKAKSLDINVSGPYPADTIFLRAQKGEFDSIVGMYHDQINIGRKLIGGMKGTTLFMGLPVPCGTPAHGTAFGKAGKGTADYTSMKKTLEIVSRLAHF